MPPGSAEARGVLDAVEVSGGGRCSAYEALFLVEFVRTYNAGTMATLCVRTNVIIFTIITVIYRTIRAP
jgi:hypothetical protein